MAKNYYKGWSNDDLIKEVERLRKRKKYGLVWEDKPEGVVERCKTELPVLDEVEDKEINSDPDGPVNLMIEGDNYHALSVLNYTHKDRIDIIYIDPPYNTGARDWTYNNNFVDAEDPYRHTKWISFMAHRLRIAKNVLAPSGIICVTIDDYELPRLWMLMEDIFGEKNYLGTIAIRINPGGRKSKRKVAAQHEYALFFSKRSTTSVAQISLKPIDKSHSYKQDEDGNWYEGRNLRKEGADSLAKPGADRYYPIYYDPKSGALSTKKKFEVEILPIDTKGQKRIWRQAKSAIDGLSKKGDIFAKETRYGLQVYFKFRGGLKGETPKSFWDDVRFSASEHGTQILDRILGVREIFNFPKSSHAAAKCIEVASSKKDAIVLDFFAGSGTTGQAVLELNKQDGGNRKFILSTNNESSIATNVCYPRIKKVIDGYKSGKEKVEGLGGNLKYFRTSFVPAETTDKNKTELTEKATEMLCVRDDTFELVIDDEKFKIFKGKDHHTGIIFEQLAIDGFKKTIAKIDSPISVYVFSLGDDTFEDEFADVKDKVTLSPIPEAILRVYRRIFK